MMNRASYAACIALAACSSPSGATGDAGADTGPVLGGAPRLFYTDILSGPNSGGEGGAGTYLSIFGAGFGSDASRVTVTVGGGAVSRVLYLGPSNGRAEVQQLSVQLGPACASGAIKVTVDGTQASGDQTFTVRPGKITLVTTATAANAALDAASPGDTIVLRGGVYREPAGSIRGELEFHNVTGASGAPIMLLAYPGEVVTIEAGAGVGTGIKSYFDGADGTQGHLVIAGFHVDMGGGGGGVIGISPDQTDIRIVNNEARGMFDDGGGAGAIDGSGTKYRIIGNHVHDNGGSKLYHALYFDGRAAVSDDYEIAYNHIHHQTGGRGIQIYGDTGRLITNVRVHHNVVHNIHLDGILFGDQTGVGCQAYDNIVYETADPTLQGPTVDHGTGGACIRFNSPTLVAEVDNNTFVDCAKDADAGESEGILFQAANAVTLRNNIIAMNAAGSTGSAPYARDLPTMLVSSNNLWSGNGVPPGFDTDARSGDPLFANAATADFHLGAGSPAIDHGSMAINTSVTSDFDGNARSVGSAPDIGAFETQ